MKLSYRWLREWAPVPDSAPDFAARITLAGLECSAEPMVDTLADGVVVGRILKAEKHPQADRLQVCEVDGGSGRILQIVCGAANARVGLCAPLALVGARLPGGTEIKQASLRGVDSSGMLCSAKELGLAEKSEGLLELDADAKPGAPIAEYLSLADDILNLEITPNRGDALSISGLARDVGALYNINLKRPNMPPAVVVGHQQFKVEIEDTGDCPVYAGRVISKLKPQSRTPDWMRERLRRSGIRCIHPVVDVTNYVMLELGQPLHAFDTGKLSGSVRVRKAKAGESLQILSGETLALNHGELLIADDRGPLALAGVMGGIASGVTEASTSIFLESACFSAAAVAGTARRHKLNSDASYRFERMVDPGLQRQAMERASQLIVQICGGEVHPITQAGQMHVEQFTIRLRRSRIKALLGHEIAAKDVEALLSRLGIGTRHESGDTWIAKVPSYRTDLRIEHDLIEEIARLYGYANIPALPYRAALAPSQPREAVRPLARARDLLAARGWQEVVTLAFADPRLQNALTPHLESVAVANPIAEQLSLMRSTLWAGMIPAWLHNHARQVGRTRLFECGVCFERRDGRVLESMRISGLAAGDAASEQWSAAKRAGDFYDIKAEVQALLGRAGADCRFHSEPHPALHPGRSARITRGAAHVGWLGELHPSITQQLALPAQPIVFELDWNSIRETAVPHMQALSEFPSSRRDIALVVPASISADQIVDCVQAAGGKSLSKVFVFDIYRGKGLSDASKSVALGLIFNNYSRTLTTEEIDTAVAAVTQAAAEKLGAVLRQ